jgi:hypothetical protein
MLILFALVLAATAVLVVLVVIGGAGEDPQVVEGQPETV